MQNISLKQRVKLFFDSIGIKEDGFSLLVVLLFVGVIGSLFSGMLWYQQDEVVRKKSYAAGWHLVQLSKAARIYVRDRTSAGDPAFSVASLETASVEVSVADLIAANLLPAGFTATNPLGQNVRIFADNYPPIGGGTSKVPTAYLITDAAVAGTRASVYATTRNMASLMQGAREAGMAASAPLIANGVNSSDDCSGSPAVMIWDTGCLNATDIDKITGSAVTVAAGQVVVPSWRVVNQDFRALMRYPQPENIGANTMLTDLHMGNALDPENNPDNGGVENRFNISNIGGLNVVNLFAADQGGDGDAEVVAGGDVLDLGASGDANNSGQHVLNVGGNLQVSENFDATNTTNALRRSVYMVGDTSNLLVEGDMTAQTLSSTGTVTSFQNGSSIVAVGAINANNITGFDQVNLQDLGTSAPVNLNVSGNGGTKGSLIVQDMNNASSLDIAGNGSASDADLRVFTQMTMRPAGPRTIQIQGTSTTVGDAQIRAGTFENATMNTSTLRLLSGGRVNGNTQFLNLDVGTCDGQCPNNVDNDPPTP